MTHEDAAQLFIAWHRRIRPIWMDGKMPWASHEFRVGLDWLVDWYDFDYAKTPDYYIPTSIEDIWQIEWQRP